jgi:two-component system phosphate regulon sensor histidine kinase PhoR
VTIARTDPVVTDEALPRRRWWSMFAVIVAPACLVAAIVAAFVGAPLPRWGWILIYGSLMALGLMVSAVVIGRRDRRRAVADLTRFVGSLGRGEAPPRLNELTCGSLGGLAHDLNGAAENVSLLLQGAQRDGSSLRDILLSVNLGIIAVDNRQTVVFINPKAGELLDFESPAALGKALWEVLPNEPILRAVIDVADNGASKVFPVSARAGRHLELSVSRLIASPLGMGGPMAPAIRLGLPPSVSESGVVIVANDTTRSVRYQELRKEFVANVSHELRTPLTVIKGFTETLTDGALTDPVNGPKFLATIGRHVDQLTNLVDDLLEVSRLESSPELPRPQSVDLAAVVRKTADLLHPAAQKKSQTISLEVSGHLPRVLGNPEYLHRAITNLVDNAIKYTPEGGTIIVRALAESEAVIVEVIDNGIGIAASELDRVFERFYRVDRSRSREMGGTGLGLSIVKHVAQVHGGSIDVSSTPGKGSTFRLLIPRPMGD